MQIREYEALSSPPRVSGGRRRREDDVSPASKKGRHTLAPKCRQSHSDKARVPSFFFGISGHQKNGQVPGKGGTSSWSSFGTAGSAEMPEPGGGGGAADDGG